MRGIAHYTESGRQVKGLRRRRHDGAPLAGDPTHSDGADQLGLDQALQVADHPLGAVLCRDPNQLLERTKRQIELRKLEDEGEVRMLAERLEPVLDEVGVGRPPEGDATARLEHDDAEPAVGAPPLIDTNLSSDPTDPDRAFGHSLKTLNLRRPARIVPEEVFDHETENLHRR